MLHVVIVFRRCISIHMMCKDLLLSKLWVNTKSWTYTLVVAWTTYQSHILSIEPIHQEDPLSHHSKTIHQLFILHLTSTLFQHPLILFLNDTLRICFHQVWTGGLHFGECRCGLVWLPCGCVIVIGCRKVSCGNVCRCRKGDGCLLCYWWRQ